MIEYIDQYHLVFATMLTMINPFVKRALVNQIYFIDNLIHTY